MDVRNYDAGVRLSFAHLLAEDMRFVKREQQTSKLVMMGDFNMNPYDSGMNVAAGLNAMMTRSCVANGVRRFLGESYDFYYNPMWSLFGDNTDGPAGTVYDTSNQGPYGWSMFDQVVMNHSMVGMFRGVKILTEAGKLPLKDGLGRPDSKNASDHFPILVTMQEENDEHVLAD